MTDQDDKRAAVLAVVDAYGEAAVSVKHGTSQEERTVNPATARRLVRDGVLVEFRSIDGYAMVRRA